MAGRGRGSIRHVLTAADRARIAKLICRGMSNSLVCERTGFDRSVVERVAERIGPDGSVMDTAYGAAGNGPDSVCGHGRAPVEVHMPTFREMFRELAW